jgi:predicted glycoside hydrolase/deacetylase ChbG (UPF0249 family)
MPSPITKSPKKLIINADDYGASETVNTAVEELIVAERLGGVSVLANGGAWEAAVAFLRRRSEVSVGIHLNLIEGLPVASPDPLLLSRAGNFLPRTALLRRWLTHPQAVSHAVEREWRAQIEWLLQAGLRLTHADSHQHLHAFPLAFRIAVKLCRDYGIAALRMPRERNAIAARQVPAWMLRANLALAQQGTTLGSLRCNDHFLGFKRAGGYGLTELLADLPQLSDGVTELALHPSTQNHCPYPTLRGKDERDAVLSDHFQSALDQWQITLTNWQNF